MTTRWRALLAVAASAALPVAAVSQAAPTSVVLRPARVFDGVTAQLRSGWEVVVSGGRITAAGPAGSVERPAGARVIDFVASR
jgi:imidazolonepropionase-like amidohydrolase